MNVEQILAEESQLIGKRIIQLRLRLGIAQKDLARGCRFSLNTIAGLEKGSIRFNQHHRFHICRFFGVNYDLFDPSKTFSVPDFSLLKESSEAYIKAKNPDELKDYREKLAANKVLSILRERVLPSGFLNEPREVKTIRILLKEDYAIQPSGSTISNALKKLIEENKITKVASSKKRVFLYVIAYPAVRN